MHRRATGRSVRGSPGREPRNLMGEGLGMVRRHPLDNTARNPTRGSIFTTMWGGAVAPANGSAVSGLVSSGACGSGGGRERRPFRTPLRFHLEGPPDPSPSQSSLSLVSCEDKGFDTRFPDLSFPSSHAPRPPGVVWAEREPADSSSRRGIFVTLTGILPSRLEPGRRALGPPSRRSPTATVPGIASDWAEVEDRKHPMPGEVKPDSTERRKSLAFRLSIAVGENGVPKKLGQMHVCEIRELGHLQVDQGGAGNQVGVGPTNQAQVPSEGGIKMNAPLPKESSHRSFEGDHPDQVKQVTDIPRARIVESWVQGAAPIERIELGQPQGILRETGLDLRAGLARPKILPLDSSEQRGRPCGLSRAHRRGPSLTLKPPPRRPIVGFGLSETSVGPRT